MAEEGETSATEDQLTAAVAKAAGGKIVDKSSSTEEKNESGAGSTEEDSGGAGGSTEEKNEENNSNSEGNEAQNEHQEQNQGKEKNDGENGGQQDGDDAPKPEELVQTQILELKKLPENESKSEEDLRKIVIEKAERSLHPDNKNESGAEPKVIDLNAEVKKSTNGQFESLEQMFEATKQPELTFANDQIKHLNELASKGVQIDQVLAFANLKVDELDPSKMEDAKKLIRIEMKQNEPGITDEEIDYDLRQLYDLTEQKNDDDEVTNTEAIRNAELKLLRNAKNAKSNLITKQKELEIPAANAGQQQSGPTEEQKRDWSGKVDNSLENYESLEIPIGTDQNFKFQIAAESKETLKTTMLQPEAFLSRYVKDGQADMEKFRREMTILDNYETIFQAIHTQGDASGAKRVMDSIQNPSTEKSGNQGGSGPPVKTGLSAVADAYSAQTV